MVEDVQLIVLYDGNCGFCSRTVQFVLKHGDQRIKFSPLGSELSMDLFKKNGYSDPDLETFYFVENEKLFDRSGAAFKLAKYLKTPYRWMTIFRFLPRGVTDSVYDLVARNRKKLAGESCLLPTIEERKRFI